jgi:hypothetical protein
LVVVLHILHFGEDWTLGNNGHESNESGWSSVKVRSHLAQHGSTAGLTRFRTLWGVRSLLSEGCSGQMIQIQSSRNPSHRLLSGAVVFLSRDCQKFGYSKGDMALTMMPVHDAGLRSLSLRYQVQPYETGTAAAAGVGLMLEWTSGGAWSTPFRGSGACNCERRVD